MQLLGKFRRLKSDYARQSTSHKGGRVLDLLRSPSESSKSVVVADHVKLPPADASELERLKSDDDATGKGITGPSTPLSDLWMRALIIVQQQDQWTLFCKIVEKELGHTASTEPLAFTPRLSQGATATVEESFHDLPKNTATEVSVDSDVGLMEMLTEILHALNARKSPLERGRLRELCVSSSKILISGATIGNALTSLNPYASLAWGLVQFIAGAVVSVDQVQEACWRNLDGLGELVEHARTLRQYYECRTRFQHADLLGELDRTMIKLLASIIAYQVSVIIFNFSKAEKSKAIVKGTENSSPMKLFREIETNEDHLTKLENKMRLVYHDDVLEDLETQLLQTRASLKLMESRIETHLQQITDHLTTLDADQTRKEYDSIVNWISPLTYEDAHSKGSRLPMKGTTDWLFQLDQFRSWKRSERNEILWLDGKLGSGKTCVTHSVIDECIETCKENADHGAAYFYCDATDGLKAMETVSSILCCLLKQLVVNSGPASMPYQLRDLYHSQKHTSSSLTSNQCLDMLRAVAGGYTRVTFILDGFDECPDSIRCDLVESLVSVLKASPTTWKLFVSTRRIPDATLLRDLHQIRSFHTNQIEIEQHNEQAIEAFVEARVRAAAALDSPLRRLYHCDGQEQTTLVEHELKARAQGVFRWAAVALDFLHRSKHYRSMRKATNELRAFVGLNSLYEKLYNDISGEAQERGFEDKLRLILSFVLYGKNSHGPRSDHVADACSYFEKDCDEDQPSYTIEDIAAFCPSLIECDRNVLILPHFSVREFLLSRPSGEFRQQTAHAFLADKCLRIFTQPGNAPLTLTVYATKFWDQHLRSAELNGSTRANVTALCASLKVPSLATSVDEFLLCAPSPKPFQSWLQTALDRSTFTPNIRFATVPSSTLFARISLDIGWRDMQEFEEYQHVQSDARILELLTNHPRHMKESLMQFAISIGAKPVVEWLVAQNADLSQIDLTGLNLLEHYVLHRGEERELSFPSQPPTTEMINYLKCQGLDFQVNADGENVLFQMALQPPLFFNREIFEAVTAHNVATIVFNSKGKSLLEVALAGPSKVRVWPHNAIVSLIGPSYLDSEHWESMKDEVFRLVTTARFPNAELLSLVLKRGIDVTRREKVDKHAYLPIERMTSVINFHGRGKVIEEALELLTVASIEQGVNMESVVKGVHVVHKNQYWPFFSCILEHGNFKTIKMWVECGANPRVSGKIYKKPFSHSPKRSAGKTRYPVEVANYFMSLPKAPKVPKATHTTTPITPGPLDIALDSGTNLHDQPAGDKSGKLESAIDAKVPDVSNIRVEENVFCSGTEVIYLN